jgi:hypothetical protein
MDESYLRGLCSSIRESPNLNPAMMRAAQTELKPKITRTVKMPYSPMRWASGMELAEGFSGMELAEGFSGTEFAEGIVP